MVQLSELCTKASSGIAQKDLENHDGFYPIYGASGLIKYVDFYHQELPYVAVVKDGAGVGRVMQLPAKSSVIGTMQYIIPNAGVSASYLAYAMEHMNLAKYRTGATIPHIYFKDYCKEELQFHSEAEQTSIASVLDRVSGLISLRKQQLAKLDELVKARFVEMFGDLLENKYHWQTVNFEEAFHITSSKRILKSEWKKQGIPFLRVRDMVQLADNNCLMNEFFVSEEFYSALTDADGKPRPGDILMSATSTLGKCHIVGDGERFYFKDADVLRFRAKIPIAGQYFVEMMNTKYIKDQITQTLGVTTVSHFTIAAARKIDMRVPDLILQNSFSAFVERMNKSRLTIQRSLDKLEVLKKSLMQEYFG